MQLPKPFLSKGIQAGGYKIIIPKSSTSVIPSPGNNFVGGKSQPRKRTSAVRSGSTPSVTKKRKVAPAVKRKAVTATKRKGAAPAKRKQVSARRNKKTTARPSANRGKTVRFASGKIVRFANRKKTGSKGKKKGSRTIFD